MNKTLLIGLAVLGILVAGFFGLNAYIYNEKQVDDRVVADPKDGWYLFSNEWVHLVDGKAEVTSGVGSTSYQYFGNEARGDIDGNGDEDVVFLVTQNPGGSGTFFFLVGAIKEERGYRGTHAMLIGDRIAPQTTEFRDGRIIVNYADRKAGEPFTTAPSEGKSLFAKYDPIDMMFGEVVQNFEGEHTNTDTFARISLQIGATVQRADFAFTLEKIIEDSRCPVDVSCVWAGRVRVAASHYSGSGDKYIIKTFNLGVPVIIGKDEITLVQVTPAPRENIVFQPTDYTFIFEIKKR